MMIYCENLLRLDGKEAEIQRFVGQAKRKNEEIETDFSFQKFLPVPEYLESDPIQEERWWIDNWGIWGDVEALYDEQRQAYQFTVEDNGEPPIRGLFAISKRFPYIRFTLEYYKFQDEKNDLATRGRIEFQNGEPLSEKECRVQVIRCQCCRSIKSYKRIKQSGNSIDAGRV